MPAPGLETRLTTYTPAARNRSRSSRGEEVVLLEDALADLNDSAVACFDDLQGDEFELAAPHDLGSGRAAHRAAEGLDAGQRPLGSAIWTEDDDRDVLDLQAGACDRRAFGGQVEGEEQRLRSPPRRAAPDAGAGPRRDDADTAEAPRLLGRHLDQAERDGELVHGCIRSRADTGPLDIPEGLVYVAQRGGGFEPRHAIAPGWGGSRYGIRQRLKISNTDTRGAP